MTCLLQNVKKSDEDKCIDINLKSTKHTDVCNQKHCKSRHGFFYLCFLQYFVEIEDIKFFHAC